MKRNFLYLAVLTLLAVLVVILLVPGGGSQEKLPGEDLLLPEIAEQINAVDSVEIVAGGNRTVATLQKVDDQWQLEQMYGYRADWSRLRTLLAALAQARVVEAKTDKVKYYSRLGVEDIATEDAGGVLLRLGVAGQVTGILIGKQAQGRVGQYVRMQGSAGSVLLDRDIDVLTGELDWVDKGIIDIDVSEVAEVEIIHPGGERVLVTKISADQIDFDLVDLPEGREIKSDGVGNSMGSILSMLDLEGVRPAGDVDWGEAIRMRFLTFSGMEIMADVLEQDDEHLLRLNASHPAAAVTGNESLVEMEDPGQADLAQAMDAVTETVDTINQQVSGWVYTIAKYKFEAMARKPEDLLKPLEQP